MSQKEPQKLKARLIAQNGNPMMPGSLIKPDLAWQYAGTRFHTYSWECSKGAYAALSEHLTKAKLLASQQYVYEEDGTMLTEIERAFLLDNGDLLYIKEDYCLLWTAEYDNPWAQFLNKFFKEHPPIVFNENGGIYISMLNSYGSLDLEPLALKVLDIDLNMHYNDSFIAFNDKVHSGIKSDKSGIILMHGLPGTGKTTYIRYLTKLIPDKKFIFMPLSFGSILSSPNLIGFLRRNANSILVFEDAENVIQERDISARNDDVANLLNITDGLLGDALKMKVICTFNCPLENIDAAILRPGRCIADYKFDKLTTKKANSLAKHLKIQRKFTVPATLAEVVVL